MFELGATLASRGTGRMVCKAGVMIATMQPKTELSDRERQILALVARGETNSGIAYELKLSAHTINNHLRLIFAKLGVNSRAAAASRFSSKT